MYLDIDEVLKLAGYQYQFEYGTYGYDWFITKVFTKDMRVFTLSDGGCSCNGYGDNWYSLDEAIGAMHEVTSLPSFSELRCESDAADTIRNKFYNLGLRP